MTDSKTTTTTTIAGGSLTSTPTIGNGETKNQYGFAAIKSDGSVVAWGQNATVPSSLDGTVDATQIYSNNSNFVALRTDGALIPLGNQSIDAATLKKLDGTVDVKTVASTNGAFAALLADGSVVTFGTKEYGGDSKLYVNNGGTKSVAKDLDGTIDVIKLYSNGGAFFAIRADGSLVTWGNGLSGTDTSAVAKQLDGTIDVTQIYSNENGASAALRADGSVVTWGSSSWENSNAYGGDSSSVSKQLDGTVDVTQIYSNNYGFAALRTDGFVVSWGGYSANLSNIKQVYSNLYSFAALKTDGSVAAWGWGDFGGNTSTVAKQLDGTVDVKAIYSNNAYYGAFAAIRADGSVVTWGDKSNGGDSRGVAKELDGTIDVTQVYSINNGWNGAFAALRADGSVVTWGSYNYGGDSTNVSEQLNGFIDVTKIYSNSSAFATLRADGSVVSWGYGIDTSKVANQLDGTIDVIDIQGNGGAFAALRADGSVVTWGDSWYGGDSSSVKAKLTSGVETFANIATDDFYTAPGTTTAPPVVVKNNAPTGTLEITGTVTENETLTASNRIADVDGLGKISYQWLSDGASIIGAIQPSYTLSQMDVGKKISVVANYTDGLGKSEGMTSSAVTVLNVNDAPTGSVSISGTTAKGQTLTATNTLSDADGLGVISYQWLSGGKAIKGANQSTYTLAITDMAKKISVKASYTDLQGTKESVISGETAAVTPAINHAPTGTVLITGELKQNQTVSVSNNLADVDGLGEISYQWYGDSVAIKDATQTTYKLTQSDVYKTLSVKASYTDKLGKLESVSGGVVLNENDKPEGSVIINGIAKAGEVLTVQNSITDIDGFRGSFTYQWQADGEAFAEGDTLVLTKDQIGKAINVVAQYTDDGGTFESVASAETTKVIPLNTLPTGYVIVMGEQKN
ncbi:MAG: hypothetical protein PHN45_06725, partial [Methylococcales bacterium]|nr:hypothetical protein [Methylococcales bacterium]